MRRGSTPTHTFKIPFDTSLLAQARIVYAQLCNVVLVKTGEDLVMEGNTIKTRLTQEETLAFNCSHPVEIQLRVLTQAGDVQNSDIVKVSVKRCLESEVMA